MTENGAEMTIRYRIKPQEAAQVDELRGTIPRNLWMREAALRYARLVTAGEASPPKGGKLERSRGPDEDPRRIFVRFRLQPPDVEAVQRAQRRRGARKTSTVSLWMREAALRYVRLRQEGRA